MDNRQKIENAFEVMKRTQVISPLLLRADQITGEKLQQHAKYVSLEQGEKPLFMVDVKMVMLGRVTGLLVTDRNVYYRVSNDRISINESDKATWRKIKKEFPHSKHRSDYPAVKIGRLGVNVTHQNEHLGRLIINFVKDTFITNNRMGCAFITVDALREAVPFYQKNGFKFLKPSEASETGKETVPMYYDLTQLL